MFFHSINTKPQIVRRPTATNLHDRLSAQIAEVLQRYDTTGSTTVELPVPIVATTSRDSRRRSRQISVVAVQPEAEDLLYPEPPFSATLPRSSVDLSLLRESNNNIIIQRESSPQESLFSLSEARRLSKQQLVASAGGRTHIILRRPTITIHEDGRIVLDHVTARWDGVPLSGQTAGLLDIDDGGTIITDTKEDLTDGQETTGCPQKTLKYAKILTPHIILVSVLIGYLCLGAWILMMLETRTELMARSRKLVRLANLMTNFSADSWRLVNDAQTGVKSMEHQEWNEAFREYMSLENMHNKWTFPTSLLYVLTVLTTCGYGEVSVDTEVGKVFSVIFALVGIPLMFITAADIGKFLSETLLKFVENWKLMVRRIKDSCAQLFCKRKYIRKKSLQSASGHLDGLGLGGLGVEEQNDKLWFSIGAYVACICLYCSMGSMMFISWQREWSFIHAFHFGFNLIVTVGLGDIVVTDYLFLTLIVAFVIVGLSVVTMCVDLASTHLKAYFTRIHYFGRARRIFGMSEELKEIVALLGAMRKKRNGKVTWNDVRDFLDNELRDRPFEPHELLMKLRFIDETTSSGMSTIRHNSFQSDFFRDNEYFRRLTALRPEQPAYL
ncbi:ion channel domain-containing protein [Ditylenchus destructor]|nr:ion channel domain-containing protein [Ditylenchus destructor]